MCGRAGPGNQKRTTSTQNGYFIPGSYSKSKNGNMERYCGIVYKHNTNDFPPNKKEKGEGTKIKVSQTAVSSHT